METDYQTACCNALRTSDNRKQLIEASIWERTPGNYRLFSARAASKSARWMWRCSRQVPVHLASIFSRADDRMHAQDHPHPFAGNALPPTRRRRIAVGKSKELS